MVLDRWEVVKAMMRKVYEKKTLFGIPPINVSEYSLRLKEFIIEVVASLIYERFIGAWSMFPHFWRVFEFDIFTFLSLNGH